MPRRRHHHHDDLCALERFLDIVGDFINFPKPDRSTGRAFQVDAPAFGDHLDVRIGSIEQRHFLTHESQVSSHRFAPIAGSNYGKFSFRHVISCNN